MRTHLLIIMAYEWRILKAGRLAQLSIIFLSVMIAVSLVTVFLMYSGQYEEVQKNRKTQKELYNELHIEISKAEQQYAENWQTGKMLRSGSLSPSALFDRSANFRATNPAEPLTMLNRGQLSWSPQTFAYKPIGSRFTPFYHTYDIKSIGSLFPERSTDNPLMMLLGQLDLAFITLNIVPLLLLALSFNFIAFERESGTLALLLTNPVSFKTIVIGKLAVRFFLFLSICALLPLMLMLLLTAWHNSGNITRGLFINAGIWILAVSIYIMFWLIVSLFINAFNRSSSFNALLSVIVWLGLVALIPAICNQAIKSITPGNLNYRFITIERKASLGINAHIDTLRTGLNNSFNSRYVRIRDDQASQERYDSAYFLQPYKLISDSELVDSFISFNPEWRDANTPNQLSRILTETRSFMIGERLKNILGDIEESKRRQRSLSFVLGFTSPTVLLKSIFDDVSGAGTTKTNDFLRQLDTYIRNREASFSKLTLDFRNLSSGDYGESKIFTYQKASMSLRIGNLVYWIGGIMIFTGMLFLWSLALFKRYRMVG